MITIFVFISPDFGYTADRIARVDGPTAIVGGNDRLSQAPYYPSAPGMITQSPGEIVGTTQYDYQTNGSTGNRVVLDSQGGKHFSWMNGLDYNAGMRAVYFNYCDASGEWPLPEGGQPISDQNGAGYVQIGLTSDDRAIVGYHQWLEPDYVVLAVDQVSGFGIFNYYDPPDMLIQRCFWPYVTVDRNDNIHIISVENAGLGEPQAMGYTMSDDGGASWSRFTQVDTLMVISPNVVASPVSDKVAIVYTHPLDFVTQWNNDIYYVESEDGLTWDFANGKVNVTEYGSPDSLFAYTDLAAIYDHNDNLNIIWSAQWVTDSVYYRTFLLHYSTGSGMITEILQTPSEWVDNCSFGVWNRPVTKMSLAAHPNAIFAVYTKFDTTDCSLGGFANGDIYATSSVDGGATWAWNELPDTNLTNSPSPNCAAGDCDSDHWSSAADKVDDFLHIIYINDKDAGGVPQDEGAVTDNPVLYLKIPVPLVGIDDGYSVPTTFALSQNYPNPFNARTNIEFELLENSRVKLSVYDITGAKVATLINGEMDAGVHSINWSADNVASGVYYYSLKANGEGSTRKMTLLK